MLVGLLIVKLHLPWVQSLKEKRSEIKSLVQRTRQKFFISVAESNHQDKHQLGEITVAVLAHNQAQGDKILDSVLHYIENHTQGEITQVDKHYY